MLEIRNNPNRVYAAPIVKLCWIYFIIIISKSTFWCKQSFKLSCELLLFQLGSFWIMKFMLANKPDSSWLLILISVCVCRSFLCIFGWTFENLYFQGQHLRLQSFFFLFITRNATLNLRLLHDSAQQRQLIFLCNKIWFELISRDFAAVPGVRSFLNLGHQGAFEDWKPKRCPLNQRIDVKIT